MLYIKQADLVGYLSIANTYPQVRSKVEDIIEQTSHDMIRYVIGNKLGSLFIADLDAFGNPVTLRFVNLNSVLYGAVLYLTIVQVTPHVAAITAPIGQITPDKNQTAITQLAYLWDKGIDLARDTRKYLCENSAIYPEYCECNVEYLKKSIF